MRVMTTEYAGEKYMRGGQERSGARALPDPGGSGKAFWRAMEASDLDAAVACLAPGFTMQFPGAAPMQRLEDLLAWAKPRYRKITKTYEGFDTAATPDGPVVYCRGWLAGDWLDGTAFSGIRFIDRFEIGPDGFRRQDVWNDLAEVRASGHTAPDTPQPAQESTQP